MAKPRVTITLGSSGKVVKRGDDVMVDLGRMSGSKRFTLDKPWTNSGADNFMPSNKRKQGDGAEWRSGGSRGRQGSWIARNDLRFKLRHKRRSHPFQSAFEKRRMRNSEKQSKDIRPSENLSKLPRRRGTNGINNLSQITHNGISDGLRTIDASRSFYEMPQIIPTAPARDALFSSSGVFDPSRETSLIPFTEKTITARPVTYVAPMSIIMQRRPYVDEVPFSVATLLNSLGLGKYAIHFNAEEVDMTALRQMRDRDLKELGIPMGPRKKLLLALTLPSRRHLSRMQL